MRVLTDEDVATLARASGLEIGKHELHEVALRLSVMLDAIEKIAEAHYQGVRDAAPDRW